MVQINKARIVSLSGDKCSITFDNITEIKGVQIIGSAENLYINDDVFVEKLEDRLIVLASTYKSKINMKSCEKNLELREYCDLRVTLTSNFE